MITNSKDIIDKEVIESGGWKIGKVKEVSVDTNSWQITSIQVDLEGDIKHNYGNLKDYMVDDRFPLDPHHVQSIGDRIVLKKGKDDLFSLVASQQSENP
jgi:sporulation protein YlmC with PRC-barrel domain